MLDDDTEDGEREREEAAETAKASEDEPRPEKKLPREVDRALARAREAVREDARRREGRWLASIPVGIALLLGLLMFPRAAAPTDVPLPDVDQRSLDAVVRADAARAKAARENRLSSDVLAVGSLIRSLNEAVHADSREETERLRIELDHAISMIPRAELAERMIALRSIQLDQFLVELTRFEETGTESQDLAGLAGAFVRRMRDAGWIDENRLVFDEFERRVVFKIAWNTVTGLDKADAMQPTLDELRVLYRLYLRSPHPTELQRLALVHERRSARTQADCDRYVLNAQRATEAWRGDKIRTLGEIDPTYPTQYALGVSFYLQGNYDAAIDSFRKWIDAHPDGRWSVRARNHLKAALSAYGEI